MTKSKNKEENKQGCGKTICVYDGKSNHRSFCGCTYKGLHLCDECKKTAEEIAKIIDPDETFLDECEKIVKKVYGDET